MKISQSTAFDTYDVLRNAVWYFLVLFDSNSKKIRENHCIKNNKEMNLLILSENSSYFHLE